MRKLNFVCARWNMIRPSLSGWKTLVGLGLVLGTIFFPHIVIAEPLVKGSPPLQGGDIHTPLPRDGDDILPPGCTVAFESGPGLLGPPCAIKCQGAKPGNFINYQQSCSEQQSPSWRKESYDESGKRIPEGDPIPEGSPHCVIMKGDPSESTGSMFFPKGHPLCFGVSGDPHMLSYDGSRFDFQASGEFVASTSLDDNFEVQIRLEPAHPNKMISVATGVAIRLSDNRISIRAKEDKPLRVNGEILELKDYTPHRLDQNGALIVRHGQRYTVILADGTNVHATTFRPLMMQVHILLAESRDKRMKGISGNGDGNPLNDFQTPEGKMLTAPLRFDVTHGEFADGWRVTPETTLFDYAPGENTATFVKANTSAKPITMEQISLEDKTRAEQACRAAGLSAGIALDECIFDYALTGDDIYIESALALQIPAEWGVEPEKPSIDFPSSAFAAHTITLNLNGPIKRGSWIGFAPKGRSSKESPGNAYSEVVLLGKEKKVQITAPMRPGEYELHYLEKRGAAKVAEHLPFVAVSPKVEIIAPESASAGGEVEVKVQGDIGKNMLLSVVPLGSPDNTDGPTIPVKPGAQHSGKIQYLPKKPGKYEIRCTGSFSKKRNIYARRPLVIE